MGVQYEELHPRGWLSEGRALAILRGAIAQRKGMPPIANTSAQITCCHAGPVVLFPKQTKVMVGGSPALCAGDVSANPSTSPCRRPPPASPAPTPTLSRPP